MLAAVARGRSRITGLLEGEDVLNTARAAAALGAGVERLGPGEWSVLGVGEAGFSSPSAPLDFGNSGTGARLMMGLAGGYPVTAVFTGDVSLSSRPMERVLRPLRLMGVRAETAAGGRLPIRLEGGALAGVEYAPPEPSAQVKSAVLLAGLNARGVTTVLEKEETRDHTERMLRAFGVQVDVTKRPGAGPAVSIAGGQALCATEARVAGDPSSAAFILAAGLIGFTYYSYTAQRSGEVHPDSREVELEVVESIDPGIGRPSTNILWDIGLIIVGLVGLIFGAEWLVSAAENIARDLGVSDLVIGLTLVAVGTSLPELATTIAAVRKGEADIAIGNVVGSNLFNMLFIGGAAAIIRPLVVPENVLRVDYWVMLAFAVSVYIMAIPRPHRITRWQGGLLLVAYFGYTTWLFVNGAI